MKKILTLLLSVGSISAFAVNDNSNVYVQLGLGMGWNDIASPAFAGRAALGYDFTPAVALEVGTSGIAQSGGQVNENVQFYDLSVKGTLPLGDLFSVYGRLGGAYSAAGPAAAPTYQNGSPSQNGYTGNYEQSGFWGLVGIGAQFNFTKQVAWTLDDYYYYGSNNTLGNSNILTTGIKYNF